MTLRAMVFVLLSIALVRSATAFNYVADANGTYWGIQDGASPGVDTGSVRATQIGTGQAAAYSTTLNGFGGIRVFVEKIPAPRFNGEVMRGFGLRFDGADRFTTTQSVDMSGVTISRSIYINRGANWGRWLDTFTNTTRTSVTIRVAFGGQSGTGAAGPNSSAIVNSSSGDAKVSSADTWVSVATPADGTNLSGGPQATVLGNAGTMTFAGDWLHDTFNKPLSYSGHERNFQAYVHTLTLPAGKSESLLHFIILGARVTATTSAATLAAVEATAARLAVAPDISGLTSAEICSIANFKVTSSCADKRLDVVQQPLAP